MVLELAGPGPQPKRPSGWPIARLLPVVLVGLIFLAMLPVIGIAYFAAQSNYDASSRQINELTIDMIEQRLQAHVGPVRDQLAYISEAVAKGEIDFDDHEQWRAFALGALAAAPQAVGFVVIPVNGEPVRFTRADRSMHPERRENLPFTDQLFAQARTLNGPQWAEPQWSLIVGEPILPVIVPIRVHGQFRGVIGAAIGTSDLSRFLKSLELRRRAQAVHPGRPRQGAGPSLARQGTGQRRAARPRATVEAGRGQRSGAGRDVGARAERDLLAERRQEHRLGPLELGRRQQPWLDLPQDRRLPPGLADHRLSPGRPRIRHGRAGSCAAS